MSNIDLLPDDLVEKIYKIDHRYKMKRTLKLIKIGLPVLIPLHKNLWEQDYVGGRRWDENGVEF